VPQPQPLAVTHDLPSKTTPITISQAPKLVGSTVVHVVGPPAQVPGLSATRHMAPHGQTLTPEQVPPLQSRSLQHWPLPSCDCALHIMWLAHVSPVPQSLWIAQQPPVGTLSTHAPSLSACLHTEPHGQTIAPSHVPTLQSALDQHAPAATLFGLHTCALATQTSLLLQLPLSPPQHEPTVSLQVPKV
jgi:hypothetical protein